MGAEELVLESDAVEVTVLPELGARLHRLRAFGHDVLRTPGDVAEHRRDPFFWGGYPLAPWCNRIDAAQVAVGGRRVDVPSNFPDGTAIHGQVYARPWTADSAGTVRVRAGGNGWPWAYEVTLRVEVEGSTLRLHQQLANLDDEPMPGGLGIHPWFRRPLHVAVSGTAVFPDNADPPPQPEPVAGPYDLRALRAMPTDLDATWLQLDEPAVQLLWPATRVRATLRTSGAFIVAASPGDLDAVAIEPETHAPQGLRRLLRREPGALTMVAPGATLDLDTELSFAQLPAD